MAIRKKLKAYIFEKYFRNYAKEKYAINHIPRYAGTNKLNENLFGLAGTGNCVFFIFWDDLFKKSSGYKHKVRECKDPGAVEEKLFYEFFGYWEHWLETNCKGRFGLSSIRDNGILFYIESEEDLFYFNLTFADDIIRLKGL